MNMARQNDAQSYQPAARARSAASLPCSRCGLVTSMLLIAMCFSPRSIYADEPLGVRAVAFSPDGKLLASGAGEPKERGVVTLWEVATGKPRWRHQEKDGVPGVAFSPNGKMLAISV